MMGCLGDSSDGRLCCNRTAADVFLGDDAGALFIERVSCFGDDSGKCCRVPAYGQTVAATGLFEDGRLRNVVLCVPQ